MDRNSWILIALCILAGLIYWLVSNNLDNLDPASVQHKQAGRIEIVKPEGGGHLDSVDVARVKKPKTQKLEPAVITKSSNVDRIYSRNTDRLVNSVDDRTPSVRQADQYANLSGDDPLVTLNDILQRFNAFRTLSSADIAYINDIPDRFAAIGSTAIPIMLDYLLSMENVVFARVGDGQPIKYPTLRLALISALTKLPGRESVEAMLDVIKAKPSPFELRELAKGVEEAFPDTYREEINEAAKKLMSAALQGDASHDADLAQLFAVYKDYGNELAADVLEDSYNKTTIASWKRFSALALAQLPDGEGIPALIRIAEQSAINARPTGSPIIPRLLAQLASEYPQARRAFLDMVWSNGVDDQTMINVAKSLGGTEIFLYIQYNNLVVMKQNNRVAETWTEADIDQRLALIDEITKYVSQPRVLEALNEASQRLTEWRNIKTTNGVRSLN